MNDRKLLVLGGKPIGSCELVEKAKELGCYVVVADYLEEKDSPAKRIADKTWDVSTSDIEALKELASKEGIDGVLAGVHEFNLRKMAALSEALGLPCYCTEEQLSVCEDKSAFKKRCKDFGLEVSREYSKKEASQLDASYYPLAVKPRDGSGSRGFSKCLHPAELPKAIELAENSSSCGEALIEDFIDSDALIVQYTAHEGELFFSGLTDKYSKKIGAEGAPIMALQTAPSIHIQEYLDKVDEKMRAMLASLDIVNGPIWIELFYQGGKFLVNEAGFRFGGSLTYYLVRELYGIDQLQLVVDHATGASSELDYEGQIVDEKYVIWPLHLKAGKISSIEGLEWLRARDEFVALAQVHFQGEEIEDWGSAKQVFAYLHLKGSCLADLLMLMREVLDRVKVLDSRGNNLLFSLFDPRKEDAYPSFLQGI